MPFYKAPKDTDSYNPDSMDAVPVIASFDASGAIKPLYVRIHGKPLKVLSCWCQNEYSIRKYHCTVGLDGYTRDIVLAYHPSHSFWTIDASLRWQGT